MIMHSHVNNGKTAFIVFHDNTTVSEHWQCGWFSEWSADCSRTQSHALG